LRSRRTPTADRGNAGRPRAAANPASPRLPHATAMAATGLAQEAGNQPQTPAPIPQDEPRVAQLKNEAAAKADLTGTLGLMVDIGYIKLDEVPGITRLPKTPAVTIYAPLSQTPVAPDAVVVAGKPAKLMLLHESAIRAAKSVLPLLGRPTCMAIPAALSGGVASSLGCIGNRVYTGVTDDQFYTVVSGSDLDVIAAELETIVLANARLAEYHQIRRATLTTA